MFVVNRHFQKLERSRKLAEIIRKRWKKHSTSDTTKRDETDKFL
jgi:hypothetical protein